MKSTTGHQSATSLPRAPRDDASSRTRRYLVMMAVRVVCFVLMVAVTPYGWHTLLLGLGAVFLPYLAVVIANVGQDARRTTAVSPERALDATPATPSAPAPATQVIRIQEMRSMSAAPSPSPDERPAPGQSPVAREQDASSGAAPADATAEDPADDGAGGAS